MKLERARESSLSNMAGYESSTSRPHCCFLGELFSDCSGRRLELRVSAARVSVEDPDKLAGPLNAEQQFVSDCSSSRSTKHDIRSFRFTTFSSTRVNQCRAALKIVTRVSITSIEEHRDAFIYTIASCGRTCSSMQGSLSECGWWFMLGRNVRLSKLSSGASKAEVLEL